MKTVVAILETMWDWRGMTSGAGYAEAPRYFRISPENYTGKRLYKLIGDNHLVVTNACRELVTGPDKHGKGDPVWLEENLRALDSRGIWPEVDEGRIDLLLVCGRVAQKAYLSQRFECRHANIYFMPHPAARFHWTHAALARTQARLRVLMG